MSLRTATIRLAYANPELRPVLLPLLTKEAATGSELETAMLGAFPWATYSWVYSTPPEDAASTAASAIDLGKRISLPGGAAGVILRGLKQQGFVNYDDRGSKTMWYLTPKGFQEAIIRGVPTKPLTKRAHP